MRCPKEFTKGFRISALRYPLPPLQAHRPRLQVVTCTAIACAARPSCFVPGQSAAVFARVVECRAFLLFVAGVLVGGLMNSMNLAASFGSERDGMDSSFRLKKDDEDLKALQKGHHMCRKVTAAIQKEMLAGLETNAEDDFASISAPVIVYSLQNHVLDVDLRRQLAFKCASAFVVAFFLVSKAFIRYGAAGSMLLAQRASLFVFADSTHLVRRLCHSASRAPVRVQEDNGEPAALVRC